MQKTKRLPAADPTQLTENTLSPAWSQELQLIGVSQRSISQMLKQLEAQGYRQRTATWKSRKASAIHKALIEKYLLEE